jgi:iron complex transport system substrate-binding protein
MLHFLRPLPFAVKGFFVCIFYDWLERALKFRAPFLLVFVFFILIFSPVAGGTGVDSRGVRVTVPDENVRIVSLSPGGTETLYALGLRDEVVGVSDFCNYPIEFVEGKPRMGGYSTPNIEKIQSVSPHIVLLTTVVPIQVKNQFDRLGIEMFVTEPKSLAQYFELTAQMGKMFNRDREAKMLIVSMQEEVGEVTRAIQSKSIAPVKTFIEIFYNPYFGAGRNTLPGDLVTIAGGEIVPKTSKDYPRLSEEKLVVMNPEAIILGHITDMESFQEIHRNVSGIQAIRNNKVFTPNPDEFLRPGPRVVNALREIAMFLHPEAF